jgi:hypothetical protein
MSPMSDNAAARIAKLESRIIDLENRLAKYEKPERPAPPTAPLYPDGHTTISHVKNALVLPTADELRHLEEIVLRAYPKLMAGSDPASFKASFHRLSYVRRAEKLDTKHSLDWWAGQAEDWLRAQQYYPSRPAIQSFVAAAISMGDIGFSDPSKFPSMELAITGITELQAVPGRWRAVLASNQAPRPLL